MSSISMTATEYNVMRILWSEPNLTTREIINRLNISYDWTDSTIKTLIQRLVDKGHLEKNTSTRPFTFRPLIKELDVQYNMIDEVFSHACSREHASLISYAINTSTLSISQTQALLQQLQKKIKTAPEEVACSCLSFQCQCHLPSKEKIND